MMLMVSTPIIQAGLAAIAPGHSEVLFWGSVGVVAVLFLGFALMWFRRKFHPENSAGGSPLTIFSMESIEEMRDSGAISDDEFRRLRVSSLGLAPQATDKDNEALIRPVDVDDGVEDSDSSDDSQDKKESI